MNALRDANPIDDRAVYALQLDALEDDLLAAIVASPPAPQRAPARRTRRRVFALGAVATAAGCAALAFALAGGGGNGSSQAWAAPALRVANSVPRLLLDGWKVERADEFTVGDGEMTFRRGERSVDLHWSRQSDRADKFADRTHDTTRLPDVDVLGDTAAVFRYDDPTDDFTALWTRGRYRLELRGQMPRAEFVEVLGALRPAGVDTWLSAMPASVVKPVDTRAVVAEMLRGLPLPPGLDRDEIAADDAVRDRYQLGARVAGAVACGWLDQWVDAKRSGDEQAVAAAVQALGTSRDWPILNEMNADGDYPEVLWQYADAIAGDGTVMGGKTLSVEESYKSALGC